MELDEVRQTESLLDILMQGEMSNVVQGLQNVEKDGQR